MNPIKSFMESENLNPADIAKVCQVHPNYVYALLNGKKRPSIKLISNIIKFAKGKLTADEIISFYLPR